MRPLRTTMLALFAVALAPALTATTAVAAADEGPHAPPGRAVAPLAITSTNTATVRSFDLGDLDLGPADDPGRFRAPVRGQLITPNGQPDAPLVVVNHLRYPACPENEVAYPCTTGPERRLDEGMRYLGLALAEQGYSTLIPDLSPLYVGGGLADPYDQPAGLAATVRTMLTAIHAADRGEATALGAGLTDAIDTTRMGLIAHSRSGTFAPDFIRAFRTDDARFASALVYGGAFQTEYGGPASDDTAAMPDIPFLSVIGSQDVDTEYLGSLYYSRLIARERTAPALLAIVPGLGHTFVNQTLSRLDLDDRICLKKCPGPGAHRRFLTATAAHWLDASLGRATNRWFPLRPREAMPPRLSGLPARWTALTNGAKTTVFLPGRTGRLETFGAGASVRVCLPAEPMSPFRARDCAMPDLGVMQNASRVAQVRLSAASGVRLRKLASPIRGARSVVVQLAPFGDRADARAYSPVVIDVRTRGGRTATLRVMRDESLRSRGTATDSGVYPITTLRVRLPRWVRAVPVTGMSLRSTAAGSTFDIRAIELTQ